MWHLSKETQRGCQQRNILHFLAHTFSRVCGLMIWQWRDISGVRLCFVNPQIHLVAHQSYCNSKLQQFHHKNFHAATKKVFNQLVWIGHFRSPTKDNGKWRNKMISSCGQLYIRVKKTVFDTIILLCSFASKTKTLMDLA